MSMVFPVLDEPDQLGAVVRAWDQAGVHGVTTIERTGVYRPWRRLTPMRHASRSEGTIEEGHLTLPAMVETQEVAGACLRAKVTLTVNLDDPPTGVFASKPLTAEKGQRVSRHSRRSSCRSSIVRNPSMPGWCVLGSDARRS